ncbi:MAG: BatA and WFA domain-containing protein [Pirellulales bacterium]|nr:BatA and WFA domain-containing protein [Pirellulales bacterium]
MSFVTPVLLGGAALIAIPVVLHLIMRREAVLIKFPALRFVQQRRMVNQHRLRLRQLLLLALRCAIIALLALALARPTVRSSGGANKEGAAVASALVFDNSLRMQYEQESTTRWKKAKDLAQWLVRQLPSDSPMTLVDRAGRQRGQDLGRDAVETRIDRLEPSPAVRPMQDALRDAMHWLAKKKEYRGELYVFTDLSAEAWPESSVAALAKSLDELPGTNVYLIDVGVLEPSNRGLGLLKLSSEQVASTGILQLSTDLRRTGRAAKGETTVELFLGNGSSPPEKRGQQIIPLEHESTPIEFSLTGLQAGTHQGFVQLLGHDALPCDDVRYFTLVVRPPSRVLLIGKETGDTLFLQEALAPSVAVGAAPTEFVCEAITVDEMPSKRLADYSAVLLANPPPLADDSWNALTDFAESGGGVGIALGRHARREEMNSAAAQRLMPAKLRWQSREPTYLRPVAVEHPALGGMAAMAEATPWSDFPVFKYWELEAGEQPFHVVATFANGRPAILERPLGKGRSLLITTSVSDRASQDAWNLLPTGADPWPFIALANSMTRYLAGNSETQLNYLAGQTAVLPLAPDHQLTGYVLQLPDATAVRQTLSANQSDLTIATTEELGNYRVRAGGLEETLDQGFSVNLPTEICRLDRAAMTPLLQQLGDQRTRLARTREEIEVRVGVGRVGYELFPAIILAVAFVLAAEQWLANRFYSGGVASDAPPRELESQLADFRAYDAPNPQTAARRPRSAGHAADTFDTHA